MEWLGVLVYNASFSTISVISWWSVLLVEEIGVPGETHRQTLLTYCCIYMYDVVHSA